MIREAIEKIVNKQDLTYSEAYTVMNEIMSDASMMARIETIYAHFKEYVKTPMRKDIPSVAYFSMEYGLCNALNEIDELLVFADEVCLGVYFYYNAHAVDNVSVSHTLCSDPGSLLLSCGKTFLAEPLNSLVHVAVGSCKSLFAIHHAYACHLAQVLYI